MTSEHAAASGAGTVDGARPAGRRLLLVHAHPDDESSTTGATMAHYARQGANVVLVTCTRGECGEIVAADLADLRGADSVPADLDVAADLDDAADLDALGRHRETELAEALRVLGAGGHHWLGGRARWRDSGMAGEPANDHPAAFVNADLGEAVEAMVAILRGERPHVVVTYDDGGGYGHPDHIQANRVTMAALDPAADPDYAPHLGTPWLVPKVYWSTISRSVIQRAVDAGLLASVDDVPRSLPDEEITAVVDASAQLGTKVEALRAHRSQVDLDNGLFAVITAMPEFAVENYVLVRGERGPGSGPHAWEDDLFAGLARDHPGSDAGGDPGDGMVRTARE